MTISAKIIADSVNQKGNRIVTMELEYPRFIHSEFMTHRMFSRNAASSRAIPIKTMLETINNDPATPVHWGRNQAGMQANTALDEITQKIAMNAWHDSRVMATHYSKKLSDIGVHKQVANRITEPYQHMKVIVTATEWDNWFNLRTHKDAQPEIQELARVMLKEFNSSQSECLYDSEWHVPYVSTNRTLGKRIYFDSTGDEISVIDALAISASCCAQVSYRKNDESLDKAKDIFKKLIESEPKHASPIEHQAKPATSVEWQTGVTHIDRDFNQWSGNFKDWIQYRQYLDQVEVKHG